MLNTMFDKTIIKNGKIINYKNFIINKNNKNLKMELIFEDNLVIFNLKSLYKNLNKVPVISDTKINEVYYSLLSKEQQIEVLRLREIHLNKIKSKK